ncbi:peroxidase-related enzyme [Thermus tengchongensis]|uniref:Alkylhydroperoxidase n=1 Tax=Thermus tengchongensis TaxID=1214928 RepID=A0ABY2K8X6_9DEIN|nr:peroxidase-related enzyme [Thermus tengchongensis]TFU15324.1 alkylhydroperoxidase [Thermus tengchongensis]
MVISWLRIPGDEELSPEVQELFARFREKTGFVPNVARAFALSPRFLLWFRYYDALMRGEGLLSREEREAMAVAISGENRCEYCVASHKRYLKDLTGDGVLPEVLAANPRRAEMPPRMRALVEFALKVTHQHHAMTEEDLVPLREAGLSDEAILEAAEVAAMFNFTNRLLNALGIKPNPEYYA